MRDVVATRRQSPRGDCRRFLIALSFFFLLATLLLLLECAGVAKWADR